MDSPRAYTQLIETPLGTFEALWTNNGLWSFQFERSDGNRDSQGQPDDVRCQLPVDGVPKDQLLALQRAVGDYFEIGAFEWDIESLDWQGVSCFNQRVLKACYKIPAGSVLTYGKLAAQVGSPRAARAVGGAMASNRWPLLIPCHRVVGAGGRLTGYSGRGGLETKKYLLEMECQRVAEQAGECRAKFSLAIAN